jgi:Protein of unknown function (DUF1997)
MQVIGLFNFRNPNHRAMLLKARIQLRAIQALSMLIGSRAFLSSLQLIELHKLQKINDVISLSAASDEYAINPDRRKELLARPPSFWKLDKTNGSIEFGSTISLTQQLNDIGGEESWSDIAEWLTYSEALAVSIWDPKYISILGKDLYRLQVMELRFVTLSIQPTVDVIMKTEFFEGDIKKPIFTVQSISFDPKLQILPGMNFDAESLGVVIEVVGRMVPSRNGKSVTGSVVFTISGKLPLAIRILPESVTKAAAETINETVSGFVVRSFQKGAREKYAEFLSNKAARIL